ncbi:unnamed protein product [Protopolystoma xenopodis]|uniref:Uncharacterized protein n=1 Tax=Protopolystoma xenopodis TaxID=117903 RepID=A0A3S4ZKK8_9PLAT|nr:unnamed protein product [Protopolystoma xenopodis]
MLNCTDNCNLWLGVIFRLGCNQIIYGEFLGVFVFFISKLSATLSFRLTCFALDLLLLDASQRVSTSLILSGSPSTRINYLTLACSLVNRLTRNWSAGDDLRKRLAARRAALYIEAKVKQRCVRDRLQQEVAGKPKKVGKASLDDKDLPELIDPAIEDELDWRLRFPETGARLAFSELRTATVTDGSCPTFHGPGDVSGSFYTETQIDQVIYCVNSFSNS